MRLVLGMDAGASKTECLLADEEGRVLAKARGSGANFHLYEQDEIAFVLRKLAGTVLQGYGPRADALCLGMAGADRQVEHGEMQQILREIRIARVNLVTNDAVIALMAGSGERYGVTLIVGTGATAYGINREGDTARAGGWGHLLGDEGSAYWMGLYTLRCIVRAYDGRSQQTLLKDAVMSRLGVRRVEDLVHRVYRQFAREEVAGLAPLVQACADRGDAAAQEIIDAAAREFLRAIESVIGQLNMAGESFPLVLSGGLWKAVPVLSLEIGAMIKKIAPWCELIQLKSEPARGAIQIALSALRTSDANA